MPRRSQADVVLKSLSVGLCTLVVVIWAVFGKWWLCEYLDMLPMPQSLASDSQDVAWRSFW